MQKVVKPLEQVLAENKKAIQEANRRQREYERKLIEAEEQDQVLRKWLSIVIIIMLFGMMFLFLSNINGKTMQDCISKRGFDFCERKLG